tara:strand:+ start:563 stop:862 length:300 start_codon:yes stop_codon:yes gene_type:complete
MTVFAVQEVEGRNLLPAKEFGEVVFLLPPRTNIMFAPKPTTSRIRYGLRGFTQEDYLLLIGDPVAIGVATAEAFRNTPTVKFLKWDNREHKYYPVEVEL